MLVYFARASDGDVLDNSIPPYLHVVVEVLNRDAICWNRQDGCGKIARLSFYHSRGCSFLLQLFWSSVLPSTLVSKVRNGGGG